MWPTFVAAQNPATQIATPRRWRLIQRPGISCGAGHSDAAESGGRSCRPHAVLGTSLRACIKTPTGALCWFALAFCFDARLQLLPESPSL